MDTIQYEIKIDVVICVVFVHNLQLGYISLDELLFRALWEEIPISRLKAEN